MNCARTLKVKINESSRGAGIGKGVEQKAVATCHDDGAEQQEEKVTGLRPAHRQDIATLTFQPVDPTDDAGCDEE